MDYDEFWHLFLEVTPERAGVGLVAENLAAKLTLLRQLLADNGNVRVISPTIYCITHCGQLIYWMGDISATEVSIIVVTQLYTNYRRVESVDRCQALHDIRSVNGLLCSISNDFPDAPLVLTQAGLLFSAGSSVWQEVSDMGGIFGVFDTTSEKYALSQVTTADDLTRNICDLTHHRNIFVLTSNMSQFRCIRHLIGLMELKRAAGYPIFAGVHLRNETK